MEKSYVNKKVLPAFLITLPELTAINGKKFAGLAPLNYSREWQKSFRY